MKIRFRLALLLLSCGVPNLLAGSDPAEGLAATVARMARIGSARSPSFSPDGNRLAFVSDLNGIPQVWTVAATGGWPSLVTALPDPVGAVRWSPRGERLAFSAAPGGGMNQQVFLIRPDGTGLRRLTAGGRDNNWIGDWSRSGRLLTLASNRDRPEAMDVYVFDVDRNELRPIARNPGIGTMNEFGPDDRRAVLWRMKSRSDSNLFLIDLEQDKEHLLTPHEGPGDFDGGQFAATDTIYLSSNAGRDLIALARVRLDGAGTPGPMEIIAARDDAELHGFELAPDGRTAALLWNVAGRRELEFVDLRTGKIRSRPPLPAEIADDLEFSPDGNRLAMTISGSTTPTDIWIYDLRKKRFHQVTHSPHPGVDLAALVRPELVRFNAHDGLALSGWLYRPRRFGAPGPVVLSFHGGPEGQEVPRFRSTYQALLGQGIAVFAPNVRGSSGFGKRFVNLDNGRLRFDGVRDIESCLHHLIEAGVADPARIGIMGGSYGGYMTMAGLTRYPDRFAAGVNRFGVVNFETFFANTEPWMAAISTVEYGDPDTERDLLRALSPIHRLDQVNAPVLVLHGANDTNVPVVEAEQVVHNLERRGIPVEYILFPDEGHGFRKESNRIRAAVALVEWFSRHLAE